MRWLEKVVGKTEKGRRRMIKGERKNMSEIYCNRKGVEEGREREITLKEQYYGKWLDANLAKTLNVF